MKDGIVRQIPVRDGNKEECFTIYTNAPDHVIKEQIKLNSRRERENIPVFDEFDLIEAAGFFAYNVLPNHGAGRIPELDDELEYDF